MTTIVDRKLLASKQNTQVFRVETQNGFFVEKSLRPELITPRDLEKIKHEESVLRKIDSPFVIKTLGYDENAAILMLEFFEGMTLSNYQETDIKTLLEVAILLAQGLADIHRCNIIHKDINSDNILISHDGKTIKYIDFGISAIIGKEYQHFVSPKSLEGTLAYISPEQTGRIRRPMDYRTDIYSLGVTLYYLFTQQLPFEESSPLELIHAHIAKIPKDPLLINPRMGSNISSIIMKCLSKDSNERYISALGLKNDLMKCQQFADQHFLLGQQDVIDHFQLPTKLYGRESEIKSLLHSFQEGNGDVVLISGYSGIGKTSLINELRLPIAQSKGFFIRGKFEQFKRETPHLAIKQALNELVTQLLTLEEQELTFWRDKINLAVGGSGAILVNLVPEFKHLLGEMTEATVLNAEDTIKRLHFILSNVLEVFLENNQPLALCIEDVQWVDEASLLFFEHFISTKNRKNFLLLISFRDNEVNATHPFKLSLERLKKKNIPMKFLEVAPLQLSHVEQLIKETFKSEGWQTEALAKIILKKTDGNPFFIGEFLRYLYNQDLFDFNPKTNRWEPSLEEIEALHVTENVAELMSKRLHGLDKEVQQLLKTGAAIGQSFSHQLVSEINKMSLQQSKKHLSQGLELDLLSKDEEVYSFTHDRIQQAAYQLLDSNDNPNLHYVIAKHLLEAQPANAIEIVDHFNKALGLITSPQEKETVLKYNYQAGLMAKSSGAYVPAAAYFNHAIKLLDKDAWENNHEFAYNIYTNAAICEQTLGRQEDSEEHFNLAIEKSKTKIEKAEIYSQMMLFHMQKLDYKQGMEYGYKALALYDHYHESDVSKLRGLFELIRTEARAFFFTEETLRNIPEATNPDIRVILQVMSQIVFGAFRLGMDYLCFYTLVKMYRLTMKYGMTDQGLLAMSLYSCTLTWMWFQQFEKGFKLSRIVLELVKRYPKSRAAIDANMYIYILSNRWGDTFRSSVDALKAVSRQEVELGNLPFATACFQGVAAYSLLSGMPLNKMNLEIDAAIDEAQKNNDRELLLDFIIYKGLMGYLEGRIKNKKQIYTNALLDHEIADLNNDAIPQIHQFNYQAFQAWLNYLCGEYEEALSACKKFLSVMCRFANFPTWSFFYLYYPLTLCSLDLKSGQKKNLKEIKKYEKIYQRWAKASANYRAGADLITAERLRLEGKYKLAEEKYNSALEAARKESFLQEEGLVSERLLDYYKSIKDYSSARTILKNALNVYSRWGATAFVERLKKENFFLIPSEANNVSTTLTMDESTLHLDPENLDLSTIVNASQAISKEIKLNKLVEILMRIIIVSAGADKAILILNEKGELLISAEANLDQSKLEENIPLDSAGEELCISAVKYVQRSKEIIILKDPTQEGQFIVDPYVIKNQPQSIAVIPLVKQTKIAGMIYLENGVSKGVFTEERLRLLTMLSSQIAISIDNAHFYSNLEFKIDERTAELKNKHDQLQEALKQLQETQDQLIIQEKLKEREIVRNKVGRYVPNPQIMELILEKGLEMRGEEKEVSVFFCDIRDFTTLSETLTAVDTVELLNAFFSSIIPIISKHGGFIDKYIGDAFMALFGALEPDPVHPKNAVAAAVEIIRKLKEFNENQIRNNKPTLKIGIGINCGKVLMGNIGGGDRIEYTAIGDAVNVASRVESLTKAHKADILITETVKSQGDFPTIDRGEILVKGHKKAIHIYQVELDSLTSQF